MNAINQRPRLGAPAPSYIVTEILPVPAARVSVRHSNTNFRALLGEPLESGCGIEGNDAGAMPSPCCAWGAEPKRLPQLKFVPQRRLTANAGDAPIEGRAEAKKK